MMLKLTVTIEFNYFLLLNSTTYLACLVNATEIAAHIVELVQVME